MTHPTARNYPGPSRWLSSVDARAAALLARTDATIEGAAPPALGPGLAQMLALRPSGTTPLPPGRLPYRLASPELLLHTVTTVEAYNQLVTAGRMTVREAHLTDFTRDHGEHRAAYDWMRWQMSRRLPGYGGGYPVWLWARIRRRELLDLLSHPGEGSPERVLLTVQVPRERVLLTGFSAWHDVLDGRMGCPVDCPVCGVPFCQDRDCLNQWHEDWFGSWSDRVPQDGHGVDLPWWSWPEPMRQDLLASWEAALLIPRSGTVQAVVESIEAAWVLDAVRLA